MNTNKYKFEINRKDKSCNCKYYGKYEICIHLLAANNLKDNSLLPNNYMHSEDEECFVKKIKRGAPKKAGKALEFD